MAVPGQVRGLSDMVKRWGKLPFSCRCVDGAQKLAARGFPISWRLAQSLGAIDCKEVGDKKFMEMFAGKPLPEGQSGGGPSSPGRWASCARAARTPSTRARWRRRSSRRWRAQAACSAPKISPATRRPTGRRSPPTTAGCTSIRCRPRRREAWCWSRRWGFLAAHYPTDADLQRDGRGSSAYLHVVSEALKHGFADRARFLGDTDFVAVDLPHLTSAAYHAELAHRIKPNAVLPRDASMGRSARRRPSTRTAGPRICRSSTLTATRWR